MKTNVRPAKIGDGPRPLRLRRGAVLRVMLRPCVTARLLETLAADADMYRCAVGAVIVACALFHLPRR
jgi:hypothetical protein